MKKELELLNIISILNTQGDFPTAYGLMKAGQGGRRTICTKLNEMVDLGLLVFDVRRHRTTTVRDWDKNIFHVTERGLDCLRLFNYIMFDGKGK